MLKHFSQIFSFLLWLINNPLKKERHNKLISPWQRATSEHFWELEGRRSPCPIWDVAQIDEHSPLKMSPLHTETRAVTVFFLFKNAQTQKHRSLHFPAFVKSFEQCVDAFQWVILEFALLESPFLLTRFRYFTNDENYSVCFCSLLFVCEWMFCALLHYNFVLHVPCWAELVTDFFPF